MATVVYELLQGCLHPLQVIEFLLDLLNFLVSQAADSALVDFLVQPQQLADFVE